MSATNNQTATIQAINDDYEFIQYNQHLRLIHSVKDDMYQMQSIITACKSKKQPTRWFNLNETHEILNEIRSMQNCTDQELIQNRPNLPNELKGTYVHRLLVNDIACWASRKYAVYIAQLLDSTFERERQQLTTTINEQKPRMVPENRQNDYKYLIWKETIPNDNDNVVLHLVRRHKSNFNQIISHYRNEEERWYFKENLPIAMTPNNDIKNLVKRTFGAADYDINMCSIRILSRHLERLHTLIEEYFNEFQA